MAHRLVQWLYNRLLRPYLPRKIGVLAGVPCRKFALLDVSDHYPDYKHGLLDAIHETVQTGDDVTLVAFGRGITTVHTLDEEPASVTAYEAADGMLDLGRETLELAGADQQRVSLHHAVVGEAIDVFGSADGAESVDPATLDGDVLICDCEGAELSILNGLDGRAFDRYIIETHPDKGASTADVIARLPAAFDVDVREYHHKKPCKDVVVATTTNDG